MEAEPTTAWKQQASSPPEVERTNEKVRERTRLRKTYRIAVRKYVNKGYAEKITDNTELDPPKQWFLPHHGVYKKQLRRSLG